MIQSLGRGQQYTRNQKHASAYNLMRSQLAGGRGQILYATPVRRRHSSLCEPDSRLDTSKI